MKKLLDFLFGKDPDIFNREGQVVHQLPDEKWQSWRARFESTEEYNWKHHTGTRPASDKNKSNR